MIVPRIALVALLCPLTLTGCSMFGSGSSETGAAQNQRVQDHVEQSVAPLRKEVDDLRNQTVENTREIGVLKTEVEVIKRDVSRRPVITPTEDGSDRGVEDIAAAHTDEVRTPVVDEETRLAEERAARQRAIEDRIAREKAEAERLVADERERREQERLQREKAEADRIAREQGEAERRARDERERLAREQADAEHAAQAQAEQARLAREREEAERLAREKAEAERQAQGVSSVTSVKTPGDGTAGSSGSSTAGGPNIPPDATPEEKATLLLNTLRTTSDVEAVARRMRDVSALVAPPLMKMLSDSDITAKFRAEKALSFLDPKVVTPLLIEQLRKPATQLATIKILGNLGDPAAASSLTSFLSHENRDLRFYAADSLVKLKDKRAIPYLIDYLKGSDTAKSAIAYDTLRQRTGQNIQFPFFGSKEEREKYAAEWERWWKESGDRFEFK